MRQIELLGQHLAVARKRRGETQAQWARRLGVSQPTMARMERGDPSVAMASYVMCMWLIDPAVAVADLVSPLRDHAALEREVARARGLGAAAAGPVRKRARAAAAAATAPEPAPPTARAAPGAAAGLAALLHPRSAKARP